ncbi:hypothetical protein HDU83_003036 [Entophlyctis luteolus]|nr:hypothetical protein HDU83_003036 [Entophlyctis luteolus]
MKIETVLGLTATATLQARKSILQMLSLEKNDIIVENKVRDNLHLTVSTVTGSDNREYLLETLLTNDKFSKMSAVIIYTMFQDQADEIAKFLRVRNFDAESYHAGKPLVERALIQDKFMNNRLKIVVATVAFGLGINKKDVRSVIHFNMPKSLENYVQEVGRAGRDGLDAFCHVFLSAQDYVRHRSFAYSEGADEPSIWRFILKIFGNIRANLLSKGIKGAVKRNSSERSSVSVGVIGNRVTMFIPVEETEKILDMKENVLATILAYIESFDGNPIRVFPGILFVTSLFGLFPCFIPAMFGKFSFYIMKKPNSETETNPIVRSIMKIGENARNRWTVNTLAVSSFLEGATYASFQLCSENNLSPNELSVELNELKRRKEISFEGMERSFHIEIQKMHSVEDDEVYLDNLRRFVTSRIRQLEASRVAKLDLLYETFLKASRTLQEACEFTPASQKQSNELKTDLEAYFETEHGNITDAAGPSSITTGFRDPALQARSESCKRILRLDIVDFINQNRSVLTSGRAIARIFHGISSPKFSAWEWCKNKAWNSYPHINFEHLVEIASKALQEHRTDPDNFLSADSE